MINPRGEKPQGEGVLYIVATPIGNLEDMTLRGIRILREVDLVACEDTRHTRALLNRYGIGKPLVSYFDHNQQVRGEQILTELAAGKRVALVSDAGTPTISDPGYRLVRDAAAMGIRVEPIPGPSAVVAALSASGIPTDTFTFIGFLPSRRPRRRQELSRLSREQRTLVFYESPRRAVDTLRDMVEILGDRDAVLARELTKIHETFLRGTLSSIVENLSMTGVRGEVVILVAPPAPECPTDTEETQEVPDRLRRLIGEGVSLRDAVAMVAKESGIPRSTLYTTALSVVKGEDS